MRPTKRAPDAGDSAAILSSFLRLSLFLAGRLRRPRPSAGNANRWALRKKDYMLDQVLQGQLVTLRPTTLDDRRSIYEWAAFSDVTQAMMGPPIYPEHLVPTWNEFCEDHKTHFFDGSAPHLGRCFIILVNNEPVGQVYFNDIDERDGKKRTEMDLWMRAEKYCGKGYGSDALLTLCNHVARELAVQEFMVQPSARNPRAIRAYEKIGFVKLPLTVEEARNIWWQNDYFDSVYMVKTILPESQSH